VSGLSFPRRVEKSTVTRPVNRRVYQAGVVVRAAHLVRVLAARAAVRGDDGCVKGRPS